jgi:predicted dehydrogenase
MPEIKRLRAGIIGGGFMGRVHTNAARAAGGDVVAIASSSLAGAERAAEQFGIATAFATADDLLADPSIDVVHICTPNASHASLALAALLAGKHVICEKPLAVTSAEAKTLVEAAAKSGKVAAVPFVYRYHPMVREARARVAAGQVGRVLSVRGSYLQDWLLEAGDNNWRVDSLAGGASRAFADIGSHLVDLMEFVLGDRIESLSAVTNTVHAERGGKKVETEDEAALVFKTKAGVIGTLFVSQVAPGRKNRLLIDISGTDESLEFNQEQPETLWIGRRAGSETMPRDEGLIHADAARLSIVPAGHPMGYVDAFAGLVRDVYDTISGRLIDGELPSGVPMFADGLRAAQVTEAVLRSAKANAWVTLPPAETHS